MRNIQHGLDMAKQMRKANQAIADAIRIGNHQKARYTGDLMLVMINCWYDGLPEPWSNFKPMIEEEFS